MTPQRQPPLGEKAQQIAAQEIAAETLARAQRGDEGAQRAVIEAYRARVLAALAHVRDPDTIEARAQRVFAEVLATLERFAPLGGARLSAWIDARAARAATTDIDSDIDSDIEPGAAGFADRVLAAHRRAKRRRAAAPPSRLPWSGLATGRGATLGAVVVAVVSAAVIGLSLWRNQSPPAAFVGAVAPVERVTQTLGARGAAVVEPGADIAWRVEPGGAVRVEHRAGAAFYRIAPGGPFALAIGATRVLAASPAVDIEVDVASADASIDIAVYAGRIRVTTATDDVSARAGQRVAIAPDGAVTLGDRRQTRGAPDHSD